MVKSELYSNLRDVVELLYDSLLPEGSNAVSCRDSEEELNLLQEEISALDTPVWMKFIMPAPKKS